jgi:hypothetical protein
MTAVEQLTVTALLDFVGAVKKQDGPEPNQSVYLVLLDQCLAEVWREAKAFDTYWDNTAGGDLDLDSSNVTNLPADCLIIDRVEWDGSDNALLRSTVAERDYDDPGWRDQTGETPGFYMVEGRRLFLDVTPSSPTGKLVVRGYGVPPRKDALAYLPVDIQLAPASFILWKLPWDPESPREVARHEQYQVAWLGTREQPGDKGKMVAALRDRTMEEFDF